MNTPDRASAVRTRALVASLADSAIEWFDYFLYATVAAFVFNKLFFPNFDPVVGLLLLYLSFSLTFFVLLFGGMILFHVGACIGRKETLVLTLTLIGGATVLIGCLPTYSMIGVWASVLLVLLRVVQGLAIPGEWGGALLLAYEYASPNHKALYARVPQMGVLLGVLLATLAMTVMSALPDSAFLSWGWRVPFLLSSVFVLSGLWICRGIGETPEFERAQSQGRVESAPILGTCRHHRRAVLISTGANVVETAPFYVFTTFVMSYSTGALSYTRVTVLNVINVGAVVTCVVIPFMGVLADRVGTRLVHLSGAIPHGCFCRSIFHAD